MFEFFSSIFFGIGFTISIIGVAYGIISLTEAIQKAHKQRQERYDRLIEAIEKIQAEMRDQTTQR